MWNHRFDFEYARRSRRRDPGDPDIDRLLAVALTAATTVFLASFLPGPLVALVLAEVFYMGALVSATLALLRGDRLTAPRITAWDQAALFLLLSLGTGFFADPTAMAELTEAATPGSVAAK